MISRGERVLAFGAALTSILCLLIELYGGPRMSATVPLLLLPGTVATIGLAWRGSAGLRSDIWTGTWTGFLAACAYDLFRVPFVLSGMPLFKVFPAFGASITGLAPETVLAQGAGWAYHFSNGMSFGIMYVLLCGRKRWVLGIPFALAIEAGLLLSPYARFFGIEPGPKFIAVTIAAHSVFGLALGVLARLTVASDKSGDQRMTTPA
ncbi:hypothetical protein HY251_07410 [bacterium]|nr:hypothetical protein [bacterium]